MLSKLQHTEIVVAGYTDNATVGPRSRAREFQTISTSRASGQRAWWFISSSQGVNPNLLSAQCFGETHPVAPNDTAEGQAKNRRVDITLTGDGT